jgi:CubicO group peptidase (beta-lactamase class C family)
MGSTTKIFIWLLAMQLAQEGRLDLDRDVNAYLGFRIPGKFGKPITMRHLMTHSAGFAESPLRDRRRSLREELAANVPPRVYAPGTTVAYSNYGAALAAHIVERLRGRPFDTLVQERLLGPLAMTRSSIADPLPPELRPLLAEGYSAEAWEPAQLGRMGELLRPVGALSAPADDMGRLIAMLLAGGIGPAGPIVARNTLKTMTEVQKPLGPRLRSGLGLGFIVGEHRGIRYAGHGGTHLGGASDLELLPEHGLGWNIAFNGRGLNGAAVEARGRLLRAVIERFLSPEAVRVEPRGPSAAEAAAGQYLSTRRPHVGPMRIFEALGTVTALAEKDGSLMTHLDGSEHRWLPDGPDRFRESKTGIPLALTRDEKGRVVRFGSPLLNNVAEFDRASLELRLALPIIAVALPVLLLAGLLRLFRRKGLPRTRETGIAGLAATLAGAAPWLIILTITLWPAALIMGWNEGGLISAALVLLSVLALAGAAALVVRAIRVVRDPGSSKPHRIAQGLVALSAVGAAYLIVIFEFAGVPI